MMDKQTNSGSRIMIGILFLLLCLLLSIFIWQKINLTKQETPQVSPLKKVIEQEVLAKWGKAFDELPTENLIVVSPHNDSIRKKFEHEFVKYYAIEQGKHVLIWWHQRGGSNAILDFLMSQQQTGQPLGLDVVFGGGEYLFEQLADRDMLVPLELDSTVLDQIPGEFAGVQLRNPQLRWCGNVLSGFGFLYNTDIIKSLGLNSLNTWEDLSRPELFRQLIIADPQDSGSTVAAFEMILQSETDWQTGWRKLFGILSNAKEFVASSDDAANAPLFDQAAAAICIDFYGISRQAIEPQKLQYVSPQGATAFTPDPIGILKNAPNTPIAQEFVNFVLSPQGQALWGTKTSPETMLAVNALYRTPIRKDFYTGSSGNIPEVIRNPYELAEKVNIDSQLRLRRFNVLRQLVRAAAVVNFAQMLSAKQKLIESDNKSALEEIFYILPENVDTIEEIESIAEQINDAGRSEQITAEWIEFFKNQYEKVTG